MQQEVVRCRPKPRIPSTGYTARKVLVVPCSDAFLGFPARCGVGKAAGKHRASASFTLVAAAFAYHPVRIVISHLTLVIIALFPSIIVTYLALLSHRLLISF